MDTSSVVDNLDIDLVWGDRAWHSDEESLFLGKDEVGHLLSVLKDGVGSLSQTVDGDMVDSLALWECIL